jgi:hypothetical protein
VSAYPNFPQLRESEQGTIAGREIYRSSNGFFLAVDHGARRYQEFRLQHILTDSEWDQIMSLYESSQSSTGTEWFKFQSGHDDVEYECKFASRPTRVKIGPDLYRVRVELVDVDGSAGAGGDDSPIQDDLIF